MSDLECPGGYDGPGRANGTAAQYIYSRQPDSFRQTHNHGSRACLGAGDDSALRVFADGPVEGKTLLVQGGGAVAISPSSLLLQWCKGSRHSWFAERADHAGNTDAELLDRHDKGTCRADYGQPLVDDGSSGRVWRARRRYCGAQAGWSDRRLFINGGAGSVFTTLATGGAVRDPEFGFSPKSRLQ